MDGRTYFPAGRKVFYYYHYRKDILERHGVTEVDATHTSAYALASRRSKRLRAAGTTAGGNSDDAGTYAPASRLMADIPLADCTTFPTCMEHGVPMADSRQERQRVHALQCM